MRPQLKHSAARKYSSTKRNITISRAAMEVGMSNTSKSTTKPSTESSVTNYFVLELWIETDFSTESLGA